jgi:hypothetical protein
MRRSAIAEASSPDEGGTAASASSHRFSEIRRLATRRRNSAGRREVVSAQSIAGSDAP